jgi:hypothetical protein
LLSLIVPTKGALTTPLAASPLNVTETLISLLPSLGVRAAMCRVLPFCRTALIANGGTCWPGTRSAKPYLSPLPMMSICILPL